MKSDKTKVDNDIKAKEIIQTEEKESIVEKIKRFRDNKVWISKKARMEAESRVSRNDNMSIIIVNYYTFIVIAASIYTLIWDSKIGVVLTTIASVGLFGVSNYINSMNYKEKQFKYRESYLKLSQLETRLSSILLNHSSDEEKTREFIMCMEQYDNILELSYNHTFTDYVAVQSNLGNKEFKKRHILNEFKYIVASGIIFIIPIIIIILIKGGILSGVAN